MHLASKRSRSDLDTDEMFPFAAVRLLEIIGEAATDISDATKAANPHVPWQQISRARNHLIHGYFNVDGDRVWQMLTADLPVLVPQLEAIVRGMVGPQDV